MEPLGQLEPFVARVPGIGLGLLAVFTATSLMELSRTMAEKYRGRWFAGNGRDIFHVAAAGVLASAFVVNGLSLALACFAAATATGAPLLLVDSLPGRRPRRVLLLLALFALAAAPVLIEPASVVQASNRAAAALF